MTEPPAETLDAPGAEVPPPAPVADLVEETVPTAAEAPADAGGGERPGGVPAAQLAAGGLSAGAVALGALYQLLGLPGLIGGAVLAGGSGVAYLRHRYHRTHPHRSSHGGGGGGRKESVRTVTTTGSTRRPGGGGGVGGLFGGGRSTGQGRSGGGAAGGLFGKSGRSGGGLLGGLGRSATRSGGTGSGGGGAGRGGRSGGPSAKGAGAGGRTGGGAGRAFGSRARQMAQAARKAAARISDATGGRAKKKTKTATSAFGHAGRAARRTGQAVARQVRRVGAVVDRRSGRRYSAAWAALRQGGGFRAARRRAAAALGGWDAQVTASVLALVAWIADRVKARKGAAAAESGAQTDAETAEDSETPESVVHGDDGGELPITATVTCPRCGKEHTVTVERAGAEQTAACACGYTIRLFRIPPRTSAEAASTSASTGRRGAPSTASPTTYRRSHTMSVNPLAAAAAEVHAVAAAHAPADMWQVARELDQLSEVPANIGMALRTYTVRLQGEYPIHPVVVEALGELYMAHAQLVDRAQEIGALFRQVHEDDLRREDAPRINEQAWNV